MAMYSQLNKSEIKRNSLTNNAMSDYNFKVHPRVPHARLPVIFPAFAALYSTIPESLKRKQQHFQVDTGAPIHLKGGVFDRILFGATLGLIALGLAMHVTTFYGMMYPKKKN